jgi:hypothetical protein
LALFKTVIQMKEHTMKKLRFVLIRAISSADTRYGFRCGLAIRDLSAHFQE